MLIPIWRRLCFWFGLAGSVTGAILIVLGCSGVLMPIWTFAGLLAIVVFIIVWAIGFVGASGREGRHTVWAIVGMGRSGGAGKGRSATLRRGGRSPCPWKRTRAFAAKHA
jgi:hypothetical protein